MSLSFDVLIIGSGLAGQSAALRLAGTHRVAVISKRSVDVSASAWAQGGIAAVLDSQDSIEAHIRDTFEAGNDLNDPAATRHVVENGRRAIDWLIDQGVPFTRTADGYHLTREGGHSARRVIHVADATGSAVQKTLTEKLQAQPNIALVTACTTGTHSIGDAGRIIEYGDADIMIAGGAEATISPLGLGGFCSARALSTRNDDPATASRPWDRDRDGFVLGEGAGVVVLEEYEHAKARGARIYGELAGYGMSADANHMTAPCEDGDGAGRCMLAALRNAGLNPEDIQYVNAHGTSTPLGDKAETIAVKRAFGDHAKNLVVNSTKSMTGHLLGAAGGIEAVFSALAVYHQVSPPTINIFNQDELCDLDYCANEARQMKIDAALSNSFGFGGTNGTVVFRRV